MRIQVLIMICCMGCWLGFPALATTVNVGVLSYDTFIPGGGGFPGVDAFDVADLTGAFALPSDFPVTDSLTFLSAALTLTLSDASQQVLNLGDVGPGFLLDGGGNPVVQVADNLVFASAEFTATLSTDVFMLSDGTTFNAASASLDIFLHPSVGATLTVDVDQTLFDVSSSSLSTPEPNFWGMSLLGLLWGIFSLRRQIRERV